MTFLLDMNLSPDWKGPFREAGHEAVHWSEVGTPDAEIMAFARIKGWIVFTHDLDFGTLLAYSGDDGPSVVQLREQDIDPQDAGSKVVEGIEACRESLELGALVTINLRRAKARVLPIVRAR